MTNVILQTFGLIPTNTPMFQSFALGLFMTNANATANKLELDSFLPFTTNRITYFRAVARDTGPEGTIVFDERFAFGISRERMDRFSDHEHSILYVEKNPLIWQRLTEATNHISREWAEQLARERMTSFGLDFAALGFEKPDEVEQLNNDSQNEKKPLPYFRFQWSGQCGMLHVDVSGVNSNIVHFVQFTCLKQLPIPTNYFDLLGLPPDTKLIRPPNPFTGADP